MAYWGSYPRKPTAAERRAKANKKMGELRKGGRTLAPVVIEGRTIARTMWGKSWCENLERYSDYANRLPRGRTYVRTGAVIDLAITRGEVRAMVQGSRLYNVAVTVEPLSKDTWDAIVGACSGQIDSLVELLQGRMSAAVMEVVTRPVGGLFPKPTEIRMSCSCPDWATLCKHVCAVLYGVGARFDRAPELLFELRGTDPTDLIAAATTSDAGASRASGQVLDGGDLAGLFGIELDGGAEAAAPAAATRSKPSALAKRASRGEPAAPIAKPAVAKRPVAEPVTVAPKATPKAKQASPGARAETAARAAVARAIRRSEAKVAASKSAKAALSKSAKAALSKSAKAAVREKTLTKKTLTKKTPTKTAKRGGREPERCTRAELIRLGLPPGTVSSWMRDGLLLRTEARGVYTLTPEGRARLASYSH